MNEKAALEAILFVAEAPIPTGELAEVLELPTTRVEELLSQMAADLHAREAGVTLREVAGGWRLYSHPDAYQYLSGSPARRQPGSCRRRLWRPWL